MKDLGVTPLEFERLPYQWRQRSLMAMSTENKVEEELADRARRGAH